MPSPEPRKPRRDDLPALKASAARKARVIEPPMTHAVIEIGGHKAKVGLWHMFFPKGGSWSYFLCPNCGRKCQTLRLYDGRFACCNCDGLYGHARLRNRAPRIERLRQRLAKSNVERRAQAEWALRKAILADRRKRLETWPPKT